MTCMVAVTSTKNMRRTYAPFPRNLVIKLDFIGGIDKRLFINLIAYQNS